MITPTVDSSPTPALIPQMEGPARWQILPSDCRQNLLQFLPCTDMRAVGQSERAQSVFAAWASVGAPPTSGDYNPPVIPAAYKARLEEKNYLTYSEYKKLRQIYGCFCVELPTLKIPELILTDEIDSTELREICRICPNLQDVKLCECANIADLTPLTELTSLTSLTIEVCAQVNDLRPLARIASLQRLSLEQCPRITDLSALRELNDLQELSLWRCPGIADFSSLATLTSLRKIYLDGLNISDLEPLSGLTLLESLTLLNCPRLQPIELRNLENLNKLEYLKTDIQLTDVAMNRLTYCHSLQTLSLPNCESLTNVGVSHLARMTSLQTLSLAACSQITDFGPLEKLTLLRELYLKGNSNANLPYFLRIFTELEHLVTNVKMTENNFIDFFHMKKLNSIILFDCSVIFDSCLDLCLRNLPHLNKIHLRNARLITDEGLNFLANIHSLKSLTIHGSRFITNDGLLALTRLSNLQYLNLGTTTQITEGGVEQFRRTIAPRKVAVLFQD